MEVGDDSGDSFSGCQCFGVHEDITLCFRFGNPEIFVASDTTKALLICRESGGHLAKYRAPAAKHPSNGSPKGLEPSRRN
jgi:hypothetical protein